MTEPGRHVPTARWRLLAGLLIVVVLVATATAFVRPGIHIRWVTESELDVTGYNVFRATQPDGPFGQVNAALLPPAVDPFLGAEHMYQDNDVRWGVTYYYELETVDRSGNRSRSEPITLRPRLRLRLPGRP